MPSDVLELMSIGFGVWSAVPIGYGDALPGVPC